MTLFKNVNFSDNNKYSNRYRRNKSDKVKEKRGTHELVLKSENDGSSVFSRISNNGKQYDAYETH